jgi:hypothetical protein
VVTPSKAWLGLPPLASARLCKDDFAVIEGAGAVSKIRATAGVAIRGIRSSDGLSLDQRRALRQRERDWIATHNSSCGIPASAQYALDSLMRWKDCMLRMTRARISELDRE